MALKKDSRKTFQDLQRLLQRQFIPGKPEAGDSQKPGVRFNAVTHGFAGQTCVIHEHETAAYMAHFQQFRKEYSPVGPTEEFLVQSISGLTWSTEQIRAMITNLHALAGTKQTAATSAETTSPKIDIAWGQAYSADSLGRRVELLGRYEARKMRLFTSAVKQLNELQSLRKAKQKAELTEAALYRRADLLYREPNENEWHPTENGFVCSLPEIDRFIVMQDRVNRLLKHQSAGV